MMLWAIGMLLPAGLLAAVVAACFFRLGRRILAWAVVGAVLLVSGWRLAREARNAVHGGGWGAPERAGWRRVSDECRLTDGDWSRTYEVGAEGMGRGWVGLTAWPVRTDVPASYCGKLRLEWVDGEGRTVRESVVGAEGPEGLAFSPPPRGREGPAHEWMLSLERLDTAWIAEREAADGLRLRVSVAKPDRRNGECPMYFCIWLAK